MNILSITQRSRPWIQGAIGVALTFHATPAHAFTSADADTIFAAHLKAFYEEKDGQAWFRESTGGGKVSYWMRAEQLEMVLDVFERTMNAEQIKIFTKLFR